MKLTCTVQSDLLERQLAALGGAVQDRQSHARTLGGYVRSLARKNVKEQRKVAGGAFDPRKARTRARAKRQMLTGIAKRLAVMSRANDGGGVVVGWKNRLVSHIAHTQQTGQGREWSAAYLKGLRGSPDYDAPCTRRQARALIREGYEFNAGQKGKGTKRVTVKQIERMFTLGRAGLILRMMRTGKTKGVQRWRDDPPPRPFLGVTEAQAGEQCEKLAKKLAKAAEKAGRR